MKTLEVNKQVFHWCIAKLQGFVFFRHSNGKYFIRPFKTVEHLIPFINERDAD